MNWITVRELLAIRRQVARAADIRRGLVNPSAVYSAVRRPFTSFSGQQQFPTLLDKVGALIHTLIMFHPFVDGNEATALVAADVCLRLNGLRLVDDGDVERFFRSIASGQQDVPEIAAWLGAHSSGWTEPPLPGMQPPSLN